MGERALGGLRSYQRPGQQLYQSIVPSEIKRSVYVDQPLYQSNYERFKNLERKGVYSSLYKNLNKEYYNKSTYNTPRKSGLYGTELKNAYAGYNGYKSN